MDDNNQGSYWGGWWLSFLIGVVGLIIAIAIDKPETKRGAIHGFIVGVIISVVCTACLLCAGLYYY